MKLRRCGAGDLAHWCPACSMMHVLPVVRGDWKFDGNMESPTFEPSFRHRWNEGDVQKICHYVLTAGELRYCADSTHSMAGENVPLPDVPADIAWREPETDL